MPRSSVDIDLTFLPITDRVTAHNKKAFKPSSILSPFCQSFPTFFQRQPAYAALKQLQTIGGNKRAD
jgi:hypothetical protein